MYAIVDELGAVVATSQSFTPQRIKELTGITASTDIAPAQLGNKRLFQVSYVTEGTPKQFQSEQRSQPVFDGSNNRVVVTITYADDAIEKAQNELWEKVKAIRSQVIAHVPYDNKWYQADTFSRTNLDGAIALGAELPDPFLWTTSDNEEVEHTIVSLTALRTAAALHIANAFARSKQLRAAINQSTLEELRQLDITSGWPPMREE